MSQVLVYRNLHAGCWSVVDKASRKVIAHMDRVRLQNVTFKVSEAGRQRVLKEKRKNVHAYIQGELVTDKVFCVTPVSYNPYVAGSFLCIRQNALKVAQHVELTEKGKVFAKL